MRIGGAAEPRAGRCGVVERSDLDAELLEEDRRDARHGERERRVRDDGPAALLELERVRTHELRYGAKLVRGRGGDETALVEQEGKSGPVSRLGDDGAHCREPLGD